jgi:hypothetical protein
VAEDAVNRRRTIDIICITFNKNLTPMNVNELPPAAEVCGLGLYPDGMRDRAQVQYKDDKGQVHQLLMPIDEALWLSWLLMLCLKENKFDDRLKAIVQQRSQRN